MLVQKPCFLHFQIFYSNGYWASSTHLEFRKELRLALLPWISSYYWKIKTQNLLKTIYIYRISICIIFS